MTNRQKLALETSQKRERINELLALEEISTEQRAELGTLTERMQQLEVETRAAIVAEPDPAEITTEGTPEARELRGLTDRANIGEIFASALDHRMTEGATLELQQHFGLGANQVPLSLLEVRAVTPAPADVGQNQAAIIPGVFPRACAAFLGVDMPTVGTGEAVYPVLTTNATAHTPAENADADDTTGSFSAEVLSPSRTQAAFFYSREDRARFAGMREALQMNLSDALADKLDQQVIAGTDGFLGSASPLAAIVDATTEATFATYRGLVYDNAVIDGLYAYESGDVRLVVGRHTYNHAAGQYRANNADDSAIDSLMRISGGIKVSRHVPDPVSNDQGMVISKAPMMRNAVAPVWEGVTLIPDEITAAKKGQIVITAVMLYAVKILRAAAFARKEVQLA